jgi:hypothetical protein
MADHRIERFVITAAFGDTNVARVRGQFVGDVFHFDGGEASARNVFDTELDASRELLRRLKELLAALVG